jgi:hypothetical protein
MGCLASRLSNVTPLVIGAVMLISAGSAQAQAPERHCLRTCAKAAALDLRACRKQSWSCLRDNKTDALNVADYCLDAFAGACERAAKGDYETCLADQCGIDLPTLRSDAVFEAANADDPVPACTIRDDAIVTNILTDIVQVVDNNWQTIACSQGLCPYNNVYSGEIEIGCNANAGLAAALDTYCAAILGKCKNFYAEVTVQSIDGLQYLDFSDPVVQNVSAAAGTQPCPYDSSANSGVDLSCSYSGTASADASITSGNQLVMDVSNFKVKVKCGSSLGNDTFTLYNSPFTCTASTATGSATFGYCAGTCPRTIGGVVSYLKVPSKSDVVLTAGDTKCDFDASAFSAAIQADFQEAFEPLFKQQLAASLRAPMQDVVNSIIPSLPYPPGACTTSSVARVAP